MHLVRSYSSCGSAHCFSLLGTEKDVADVTHVLTEAFRKGEL